MQRGLGPLRQLQKPVAMPLAHGLSLPGLQEPVPAILPHRLQQVVAPAALLVRCEENQRLLHQVGEEFRNLALPDGGGQRRGAGGGGGKNGGSRLSLPRKDVAAEPAAPSGRLDRLGAVGALFRSAVTHEPASSASNASCRASGMGIASGCCSQRRALLSMSVNRKVIVPRDRSATLAPPSEHHAEEIPDYSAPGTVVSCAATALPWFPPPPESDRGI